MRPPDTQPAIGNKRRAAAASSAAGTGFETDGAVAVEEEGGEGGSIGQFLVDSLTAQSLDLPPQVMPLGMLSSCICSVLKMAHPCFCNRRPASSPDASSS